MNSIVQISSFIDWTLFQLPPDYRLECSKYDNKRYQVEVDGVILANQSETSFTYFSEGNVRIQIKVWLRNRHNHISYTPASTTLQAPTGLCEWLKTNCIRFWDWYTNLNYDSHQWTWWMAEFLSSSCWQKIWRQYIIPIAIAIEFVNILLSNFKIQLPAYSLFSYWILWIGNLKL